MSQLIARILLVFFIVPLTCLVYLVAFELHERLGRQYYYNPRFGSYRGFQQWGFYLSGGVSWLFMGACWFLLWRKSVPWVGRRIALTFGLVMAALFAGGIIGGLINSVAEGFGDFIASAAAPLLWLVGTIFVWRESAGERAARLMNTRVDAVVCPTCGYNLTGLKEPRCPECGTQFTLDQLLASQPGRAQADLEREQ